MRDKLGLRKLSDETVLSFEDISPLLSYLAAMEHSLWMWSERANKDDFWQRKIDALAETWEQKREEREKKEKKYAGYSLLALVEKKGLAEEAYASCTKAMLIGGVASASTAYRKDRLPDEELTKAAESLRKKHRTTQLNFRYDASEIHSESPMRTLYGSNDASDAYTDKRENNVYRGYLYSLARLKKYLERAGMRQAIEDAVAGRLGVTVENNTSIIALVKSAKDKLREAIAKLDANQAMAVCLKGLACEYLKMTVSNFGGEENQLLEIMAMLDVSKTIDKASEKKGSVAEGVRISVADYQRSMGQLNMCVVNRQQLENSCCVKETYFNELTGSSSGKTLVTYSGTRAKHVAINLLYPHEYEYYERSHPCFMLEGARRGEDCGGYYRWTNDKQAENSDRIAIIGRDSETKYDLETQSDRFVQEVEKIKQWALSDPKPKTLVVDITLPTSQKVDPILQSVINMRDGLNTENKGNFDILVIRSEQKQQSLGTGKYAAGACFLVTDNKERREKFDQAASQPRRPDEMLATFYREKLHDQMHKMVKEQCEVAVDLAAENPDSIFPVIANGPFLLLSTHSNLFHDDKNFSDKDSYSFGFAEETNTAWAHNLRISVGARGPALAPTPKFTEDEAAKEFAETFIRVISKKDHGFWADKDHDHPDWNVKTIVEVANGKYCRGLTPENGYQTRKVLTEEFGINLATGKFTEKKIHAVINEVMIKKSQKPSFKVDP